MADPPLYDLSAIKADLERKNARFEHLRANMPLCEFCKSDQVQLIGGFEYAPAEWKCRICSRFFRYDP